MPYRLLAACFLLALSALAQARDPTPKLPSFDHLQAKATESVNLRFGALPLALARWMVDEDEDPEGKAFLRSLKSVRVTHYRFDSDFVYSQDDIDTVRDRFADAGWSRIVEVRDRLKDEAVDMFVSMKDEKIVGFAIVASEPREFTIVNILGSFKPEQLTQLRAQYGTDGTRKMAWHSEPDRQWPERRPPETEPAH